MVLVVVECGDVVLNLFLGKTIARPSSRRVERFMMIEGVGCLVFQVSEIFDASDTFVVDEFSVGSMLVVWWEIILLVGCGVKAYHLGLTS